MAALSSIATLAALGLTAGATTYGIVKNNEAQEESRKFAQQQTELQEKQVKKQEEALAQEKTNAEQIAVRDAARKRQQSKMKGGISSTVLTSPLGLNGMPGFSGKTLLGE